MQIIWLMGMGDYIDKLIGDIQYTRWQEWISTLTQVMSVWYAKKNNILVYPVGIIGVALAAYIYFIVASPPLYADGMLNIYYLLMSLYGWYNWRLKNHDEYIYKISRCTASEWAAGIGALAASWAILYILLKYYTDSNTPILDALVSSSAVIAMWWMTKRKIENWLAYILSNIVAIPLNFYKGFMLFTLMYILFLILCIMGYREWRERVEDSRGEG
jgi:nicotinamide mononucleotide transporter